MTSNHRHGVPAASNSAGDGLFAGVMRLFLGLLMVATLAFPSGARADASNGEYQAPDFDATLFDSDAVSLQGEARDDVVAALAALVRNFNALSHIDTDVKEKALAVALRLAPLDVDARAAHDQMKGKKTVSAATAATLYFTDSSIVFATLQPHAERLWRQRAQPDDEVLALLLMEISLTVLSPEEWQAAEAQKLARLFKQAKLKADPGEHWQKVVSLQAIPGDGASQLASRMASLATRPVKPATPAVARPPAVAQGPKSTPSPGPGPKPKMTPPSPTLDVPVDPNAAVVKRPRVQVLFFTAAKRSGLVVLGEVEVKVRSMDETETSLFGLFGGNAAAEGGKAPEMVLRAADERSRSVPVQRFAAAEEWVRKAYPTWPSSQVGLVGMDLVVDSPMMLERRRRGLSRRPGARRQPGIGGGEDSDGDNDDNRDRSGPRDISLPLALALDSVLGGNELDPSVAISGSLADGGSIETLMPADLVLEEAGLHGEKIALLAMPAAVAEDPGLRDRMILRDTALVTQPQVLAFSSMDELRQVATTSMRPAKLVEAMSVFAEIEQLEDLGGQLGNQFVRDKLKQTLELWPGHLSAKWLLQAGDSAGQKLSAKGSLRSVDSALAPLLDLYESDEDAVGEIEGVEAAVTEVRNRFNALEGRLDDSAGAYKLAAEGLILPLREYLSLRNRSGDNSNAAQHRRTIDDLLSTLALTTPAGVR